MSFIISVVGKLIISKDWGETELTFYTGNVRIVGRDFIDNNVHRFYGSLNLHHDHPQKISYFVPHGKGCIGNDSNCNKLNGDVTFDNGIISGYCVIYGDTGESYYKGEYKNNCANGYGKLYDTSDTGVEYVIYDGNWKDNMKNGVGISYEEVTNIYEGEWKNSKRHGKGHHYLENGNIITCMWKDNMKNGDGQIELNNGHIMINCKWENDIQIERGIEMMPVKK